jgi:hypothetical protein
MFEKGALRVSGHNREGVAENGENCTMRYFIVLNPHYLGDR